MLLSTCRIGVLSQFVRLFRTRVSPSRALAQTYRLENPKTASLWPPLSNGACRQGFNEFDRLELLRHVRVLETERMRQLQPFDMPQINPGDLVEIRYELSRTQQTQAVFQGYCVEVREKDLDSSFVLKNTYDGVGVTQMVPKYSPRLLSVRVPKRVSTLLKVDEKPITKDFRYKWHKNVRHQNSPKALSGSQKPGIRSLEPRLERKIKKLRDRYHSQRVSAGLPPYTYSGTRSTRDTARKLEVRAEIHRRCLIYTHDAERKLRAREKRKREKTRWGVYKIAKISRNPSLTALPTYHPLMAGNLPV